MLVLNDKAGRSPSMGAPGAGSDRWAIARPPAEREALNLVLDVLAQLLEDAFDVLGRAVIGECP
jgi:hypothetical protein